MQVLEWVREALHASHADERRDHEDAIKRHQAEYKRLDERIHAMYVDKLDSLVDAAFFERGIGKLTGKRRVHVLK
jgi:site-specific DNA recombinase